MEGVYAGMASHVYITLWYIFSGKNAIGAGELDTHGPIFVGLVVGWCGGLRRDLLYAARGVVG